jgi:hypothetical protein
LQRKTRRRLALAQQDKNLKILVFMGDDIGMWKIGAYHRAR